ncbi:extensin [Iris pallida]|uniref:Extensin n=1 Tax=Iris pallida TaxID=29817 RepID=A0AAX6HJB0_IRIPA|nr:extensin [Iris pallida]
MTPESRRARVEPSSTTSPAATSAALLPSEPHHAGNSTAGVLLLVEQPLLLTARHPEPVPIAPETPSPSHNYSPEPLRASSSSVPCLRRLAQPRAPHRRLVDAGHPRAVPLALPSSASVTLNS